MKRQQVLGLVLAAICGLTGAPARALTKKISLEMAVERARHNPLAQAALEQKRAASAQLDEARGHRYPTATVTALVAPSPRIDCPDMDTTNPDCTHTSPTSLGFHFKGVMGSVKAELTQPLYTFGKIDSAIDAASNNVQMNEALANGVAGDMGLEAARAYLGVDLARELGGMLDEGSEKLADATKTLEDRLAKGDSSVTVQDRLRLQTFTAELASRRSEAREAEATALAGLRALVGDPEVDTLGDELEPLEVDIDQAKAYLERAQQLRPETRAAEHGVSALEGLRDLERARLLPDLAVVGGATWSHADGVTHPPSAFAYDPFNLTTGYAALVLRWNIEPGTQFARLAQANAQVERGRDLLAAARRAGDFAVLQAYSRAVEAKSRLDSANTGEKSARGWVASVMQADAIGTVSSRDMADAYLAYFTLHSRVLQSTYDYNLAILALRRAIGESTLPPRKP
ncbi:MAG TPA: TolC family protein [Polyangiaceae bacterium]|nr:TolC family protein [Polyangiaceae bacterium]